MWTGAHHAYTWQVEHPLHMPEQLSRNSDATWLLLTLSLQLSRVVKDQLGLRIADRNGRVEGPETVCLMKAWMCLHHMSAD